MHVPRQDTASRTLTVWILIHIDTGSAGKVEVPDSASGVSSARKLESLSQIIFIWTVIFSFVVEGESEMTKFVRFADIEAVWIRSTVFHIRKQ